MLDYLGLYLKDLSSDVVVFGEDQNSRILVIFTRDLQVHFLHTQASPLRVLSAPESDP